MLRTKGFEAYSPKKSGPLQSKLIAMLTDLPKTAITMASTENLLKSVMFFDHAEGAENAMAYPTCLWNSWSRVSMNAPDSAS